MRAWVGWEALGGELRESREEVDLPGRLRAVQWRRRLSGKLLRNGRFERRFGQNCVSAQDPQKSTSSRTPAPVAPLLAPTRALSSGAVGAAILVLRLPCSSKPTIRRTPTIALNNSQMWLVKVVVFEGLAGGKRSRPIADADSLRALRGGAGSSTHSSG